MAGMDEKDDALTVARWCWPSASMGWILDAEPDLNIPATFDPRSWCAHDQARNGISDAEQVVLARGLAEQYGRALASEVFYRGVITKKGMAMHTWAITNGTEMASLATAPLASRLCALARVARENPNAK